MRENLKAIWVQTQGHRSTLFLALLITLFGSIIAIGPGLVIGATIDVALNDHQSSSRTNQIVTSILGGVSTLRENLWIAAVMISMLAAIVFVTNYLRLRWMAHASESIARRLRERLYDHLQHLPATWHDNISTGDIVQRCSSDVDTVRLLYHSQIVEIVRVALMLMVLIPVMYLTYWPLALAGTVMLPALIAFALIFFGLVQKHFKAMDEAEGAMSAVIQENLTGIRVVRAFARQDYEREKFSKVNLTHRALAWKLFKVMATYWTTSDLLCLTQMGLIVGFGAWFVSQGSISFGDFSMFLLFAGMYIWPVRQVGRVLTELGKALIAMGRIREILEAPREVSVESSTRFETGVRGAIAFEGVNFAHRDVAVLHDVSFTIQPGQTLALVGPSGSGKSTIAYLLMRFYDPTSGTIRIDGTDIASVHRKHVRGQISAVMQEPFLYGKSIRDNLRVARHDLSESDMVDATLAAQIHHSVESFEQRYETIVGERGVTLSGGQRQRVAIARALLRESPILILDDALSAVDTHTESHILDALRKRKDRQTTIIIAHRLSSIMHADVVLVLNHGRIVQRGTHDELVNQPGMYQRLWQIQTELEEELTASN